MVFWEDERKDMWVDLVVISTERKTEGFVNEVYLIMTLVTSRFQTLLFIAPCDQTLGMAGSELRIELQTGY